MMTTDIYQKDCAEFLINNYSRYPITLIKGKGPFVYDIKGKKYLDFLCGIGCTPLGHGHPVIEKAAIKQIKQLIHTSNLYYSPPSIELAKLLVELGGLDKVFFCNSGTEANEAAIKLARKYQWRKGKTSKNVILSATQSFHGRTYGSLAATGKLSCHEGFGPMPEGFKYCSWNDIELFCKAINEDVAAVILEPIQGEGGIQFPPSGFLNAVREACHKVDALLIFDEIQCGLGRTGEIFAYQYANVKPDIITLAKGIANGFPLGAICATENAAAAFKPRDHGTTFGGNPVSCAAALAHLNFLVSKNVMNHVKKFGDYFSNLLKSLQDEFPSHIKEVRGIGLMWGIEFQSSPLQVLTYCRNEGLLVNITSDNVLRLLPPYIIDEKHIEFADNILRTALLSLNK